MYVGTKLQIHYIYNSSWDELLFDKWKIKRSYSTARVENAYWITMYFYSNIVVRYERIC